MVGFRQLREEQADDPEARPDSARGSERRGIALPVALASLAAALFLLTYESAKHALFPVLNAGQSHRLNIVLGTVMVGVTTFLVLRRERRLQERTAGEQRRLRQEKRRVEHELVLFRTLMDRTNDAIEIIDPETGRFLDVNEKACASRGYTREEFLSLRVPDVDEMLTGWPPPEHSHSQAQREAGFLIMEGRHRRKDGSSFPVEINVNFVHLDRDYIVSVVRDITERKRAQASEERFRRITVNMLDMVAEMDTAGVIEYVTPSNQVVLGYRPEEMIGHLVLDFLHPDDRDRCAAAFQAGAATRAPVLADFRFRHADGHYLWLESVGSLFYDDAGRPQGALVASRDVTERKRAEESLRASETRFRALIENSVDGILVCDAAGVHRYASPSMQRILGATEADLLGRSTFDLFHPDDRDLGRRLWEQVTHTAGHGIRGVFRARHKDGSWRWLDGLATNLLAEPAVGGVVVNVRDVTEQKAAEDALRERQELIRLLLDSTAGAIYGIDLEGNCTFCNRASLAMLGYAEPGDLLHKNMHRQIHHSRRDGAPYPFEECRIIRAFRLGEPVHADDEVLWRRDGTHFDAEYWAYPVKREGALIGAVVAFLDISDRRRAEEALRQSEERFALAAEGTNDGIWDWNVVTNALYYSPRCKEMIGYQDHEIEGRYDEWVERLHPDDRAGTLAQLRDYLERRSPIYQPEFRLRHKDGSYRWILARTKGIWDQDGKAIRLVGSHTDITERKQAEEQLRSSEERFRRITTNMLDVVIQVNPEGVYEYITPSVFPVLGYRPEELIGSSLFALVHPDDIERGKALFRTVMETGIPATGEYRVRRADGEYVWLEAVGNRLLDAQERVCGVLVASRDITARKHAEEEIRLLNTELERKVRDRTAQLEAANKELEAFAVTLRSIRDGVLATDADRRVTLLNPIAETNTGWAQGEAVGRALDDVFRIESEETRQPAGDPVGEVLATGRIHDLAEQTVLVARDGTTRPIAGSAAPIRDAAGGIVGVAVVFRDVTQERRAQQRLREKEEDLSALLNAATEAIGVIDVRTGLFESLNPQAERLFGRSRAEIEKGGPADVSPEFQPDGRPSRVAAEERIQAALRGEVVVFDWVHRTGQGNLIPCEVQLVQLPAPRQHLVRFSVTDITERKRAQEALRQLNDELAQRVVERSAALAELESVNRSLEAARVEADRANRAKSEFLSRMSHELRTPLNAILGFAQLLEMGSPTPKQRGQVDQILKGGRHLLTLINEVLDIARIEAGRVDLSLEEVRVGPLFQEVMDLIRPLAEQRGIGLSVEPAVDEQWYVRADHQRIKQVLLNLVSNGVKYNVHGGCVTLSCQESGPGRWRLSVHDTGPGIPAEKLDRLFTPFDRLGAETTAVEGSGLGLVLSKRLVEAMGGVLGVASTPGGGATFWVELLQMQARVDWSAEVGPRDSLLDASEGRPSRTVLYVEDNLSNLALVEGILGARPEIKLLSALQGMLALDLARQHHPDLVLLDVHLPDINGDEVLRRMQADPRLRDIPVVVISADATARQVEALHAAGARDYLTKPIDVARFSRMVDQMLAETRAGGGDDG